MRLQRVHHDLRVHRVEAGDGFVGEDDLRVLHQRAGDGDALLLAARQRLGPFRGLFGDAEAVEDVERLQDVGAGPEVEHRLQGGAAVQDAVQDVRGHVHPGHEVELLEDHRALRLPGAGLGALQRQDVAAVDQDLARGGVDQPVHHAQEGGFPRAGPADDADHHGPVEGERHRVDGRVGAERFRQLPDFEHGSPR